MLRPTQQEVLNKNAIIEKFGIHPTNFALARAGVGDRSDNLPGIKGVGLPTIAKRFPFLAEDKTYTIEDIITHCDSSEEKLKVFKTISENRQVIEHNYKMMQLYAPSLSANTKRSIKNVVLEADNSFNKTEILKLMIQDGFGEFNWSELSQRLNKISIDN